jgi:hypothetical protein
MTGRPLQEVLVDSGYPSGEDLASCEEIGVTVYAPWNENSFTEEKRAAKQDKAQIPKDQFVFDPSARSYRCTEGKPLVYRERSQQQRANGDYVRTVRRQEHEELIEGLKERMNQPEAKLMYGKRGCTVERRFADFKTHGGLQRFSGRTLKRADTQVALTVLVHNLYRLEKPRTSQQRRVSTGETAA